MSESRIPKSWLNVSLTYLLIVSFLGCLLRLMFVTPVKGITYKYFLHAHSHVAFLGWVFASIKILLLSNWLPEKINKFKLLFWLIQFSVLGMLIFFPIQGYALGSIIFSTMHMVLAVIFAVRYYRMTNHIKSIELNYIYWGFIFMILSSAGPFALGYLMSHGMGASDWYSISIYFYLHFQYNGFFTFALFGLLFLFLKRSGIIIPLKQSKFIYILMIVSCIFSFFLSTTWLWKNNTNYIIGFISALLQLTAFLLIGTLLIKNRKKIKSVFPKIVVTIGGISIIFLIIKGVLQLLTSVPYFANLAFIYRELVIGYLHLVFLGFISPLLIAYLLYKKILIENSSFRIGIIIYMIGFVFTELLLFGESFIRIVASKSIPFYYNFIFWASCLFPVAIILIILSQNLPSLSFNKRQNFDQEK